MRVAAGVKKRRMKSGFHGLKKVFDRNKALETERELLSALVASQVMKQKLAFNLNELYDDDLSFELFKTISDEIFNQRVDLFKMILFNRAKMLKDLFSKEMIAACRKHNFYMRYTVSVLWKKDDLEFEKNYLKKPELSGRIDSIYWYERIGFKVDKKMHFNYERIINKRDDYAYSMRAFKGAKDWEKEIIAKYEPQFAMIRRLSADVSDMKRKGYTFTQNFTKLFSNIGLESKEEEKTENLDEEFLDGII